MNYIIIYLEVKHLLNFLTKEDKGNLLDALIEYGETKQLPKCSQNVLNVFNYLKPKLDAQREKAELKAKVARDNGATGGRPKAKGKPKKTQSKPKETQLVFAKPTLQEVQSYCQERNNSVNPQKWINHYESNGWKVGKNPMKDWKAAVRTWENSDYSKQEQTLATQINQICGSDLISSTKETETEIKVFCKSPTAKSKLFDLNEETRNKIKALFGNKKFEFLC